MSRNIRTLRDMTGDDNGQDSDDSGADAERGPPQEFYAGSSSGQAVQGPRGARNPDDESHIRRILQSAQAVTPEDLARGRAPNERPEDTVTLTLHLWTDGLSIDDGPLMSRQDPTTIQFLEVVGRGDIPPSIARQYPGKQIDFNITRNHGPYTAPKMKPFGGNGVRLGHVVPTVVGESSSIAAPIVVEDTSAVEAAKHLDEAKKELNTDNALPTTNIQIRLPNNQRLVAVFNQTHTLAAVRLFICTARPELIYQPFQLMNAYPPKIFEDETQTLKDANLLNSVVAIKVTPA